MDFYFYKVFNLILQSAKLKKLKKFLVKKVILTEEEMSEVVGGARVNGFIIPSNFYKAFKLGKFGR